ncbi:threonine synthase [Candidatus Riflebacteria bacterium]
MSEAVGFKCINCGKEFEYTNVIYTCDKCAGNLDVVYDYKKIAQKTSKEKISASKDLSIWRYMDFYPINSDSQVLPLQIGWTPLYKSGLLGKKIGYSNFFIKDDGRNPSASFKDRAGAITVIKALESNVDLICGASTGNAASSLSCITASIGLKTIIFVPKTAPKAKIAQLLVFGAKVLCVDGTYDEAFDLCLQATEKYGWYNRNTGYNPYTREGKKSCSFEIVEQLGWKVPDYIFVSVGDGNIISGMWKGFKDLFNAGFVDKKPRMVACQSNQSDAIKKAFEGDGVIREVKATTVADSISVDLPRDGLAAVKAIQESEGFAVGIDDSEILESIKTLARGSGVFAEPAGATSFAGLLQAFKAGKIKESDLAVTVVTGNGLKDVDSVRKTIAEPLNIKPDIKDIEENLNDILA